jgi:nitrate/nitrite-specific signal transduction histidine kinase
LINLSIPWYSPTQTVYFRYRLRGSNHDENWHTLQGPEQEIQYASLMPGQYTFEAFSMVNGITEKNSKTFRFTIRRPWWQQWWFLGSIIVLGLAIFYVFYSFRLRQLLKVETIRRNISSDLHDEVGSTLSSINIYAELAKNEKDNKEYLQSIQDNAKDIITQLDDLVWSINPKNDSFEQLIKRMQLFAGPVLAASGIQFKFHYNQSLLKQKLSINKKRNIYLLFKESVNNVLKHSKSSYCTVNFYCRGSYVFLEIKDNGVGFDMQNRNQGRSGIDSIMERARQINAKVRIQSSAEIGTMVYIAAPLK